MYVLIAIIMFGVLVAIHEAGHFTAAKCCGVKVNEFSIGMGPAIFKKQKGETLYSLRALPIGGFCAMEGEDNSSEDPRAFINKNPFQKIIILIAGSFMNYLLGFILLLIVFASAQGFSVPVIASFLPDCPYESVDGFQVGDRIIKIDGTRIHYLADLSGKLTEGEHDILVKRGNDKILLEDYNLTAIEYEGYEGKRYGLAFSTVENNVWEDIKFSAYQSVKFVGMVWDGLSQLVSGAVGVKDMSGPVGIVSMINDVGENSESKQDAALNILYFCAFIAVNLSVMNMLPIPALDGGRVFLLIVTVIIEAIIRKKIDPKYEAYIHASGMVLLLGLMAIVMYNDIFKLITG